MLTSLLVTFLLVQTTPVPFTQLIDHTTGRIQTGFQCGDSVNNIKRVEGNGTGFECPPPPRRRAVGSAVAGVVMMAVTPVGLVEVSPADARTAEPLPWPLRYGVDDKIEAPPVGVCAACDRIKVLHRSMTKD